MFPFQDAGGKSKKGKKEELMFLNYTLKWHVAAYAYILSKTSDNVSTANVMPNTKIFFFLICICICILFFLGGDGVQVVNYYEFRVST